MKFQKFALLLLTVILSSQPALSQEQAREPVVGKGLRKLSAYYVKGPTGEAVLFLGSAHTNNPTDPQLDDLEEQFQAFNPTVVLVEGGNWPIADDRQEAVSKYGEMGYAYVLARKHGVPARDADPDFSSEIQHALTQHDPEVVKLYYALRMVRQFREESDPAPLELKMSRWLNRKDFENIPLLAGKIVTVKNLESALKRHAPQLKDWQSVTPDWVDPGKALSEINRVAKTSVTFRDNYITKQLVKEMRAGQRTLVLAGLFHLEAQRTLLIPALNAE